MYNTSLHDNRCIQLNIKHKILNIVPVVVGQCWVTAQQSSYSSYVIVFLNFLYKHTGKAYKRLHLFGLPSKSIVYLVFIYYIHCNMTNLMWVK